jgi:hypothetical protein
VRRARDRTRHRHGVERGNAAAPLTGSRGHAAEISTTMGERNMEIKEKEKEQRILVTCGVVI